MQPLSDEIIIDLYWARDERAIGETDRKYGPYCTGVAGRVLRSREDAEECVNDTWLKAWNAMPPQRPGILRAFLAKITRNLALDRYRADHARKRGTGETAVALDELAECLSGSEDTESAVLAQELGDLIDRFLRQQPERERNVFIRRYFFLETPGEIAERYGLTANHVSVTLNRVRGKLKKALEEEGYR